MKNSALGISASPVRFLAALLASLLLAAAHAGEAQMPARAPIEVLATRIIFDEGRPSASLSVRNLGDIDYLVALAVEPFEGVGREAGQTTDDFMCAPAFRILHPGETFPFRIVRLARHLPEDVESLFVAALRILPSLAPLASEALAQTTLELSLAGRFKLFLPPESARCSLRRGRSAAAPHGRMQQRRATSAQFLALLGHVCFGRAQRAQSAARGPEADDCAQKRASARGARLSERKPLSVFVDRGNRHGDARAGDPHCRLTDALRQALPRRAS